ncbi:MAG: hypothetical protein KDD44_13010, partial [Bdellovibrionales bacterium]|nr:hypothetical protein [Bdellovibrionales bacterium]
MMRREMYSARERDRLNRLQRGAVREQQVGQIIRPRGSLNGGVRRKSKRSVVVLLVAAAAVVAAFSSGNISSELLGRTSSSHDDSSASVMVQERESAADEMRTEEIPAESVAPTLLPSTELRPAPAVTHVVSRGETWSDLAARYGFPLGDAVLLDKALRRVGKDGVVPGTLGVGQELEFEFDGENGLQAVHTMPRAGTTISLTRTALGKFTTRLTEMERTSHERVLVGELSQSAPNFAMALRAAGGSYEIVDELVDLLSDRIQFRRDFRLGDRFAVIFEEQTLSDGTVVGYGPITGAALDVGGKPFRAIRHVGVDKQPRYFDADAELIANTFLRYPVRFSRIS